MSNPIRFGIIGTDTSHVTAFTQLLADASHPHHVPGGRVVAAYPGGSPDFALSANRVDGFASELRDSYHVDIVDTIEDLQPLCDAVLLESVDGRVHPKQFEIVASWGKPVFIDKPFALSANEALQMVKLARSYGTPLMSCSPLRFSEALTNVLHASDKGDIVGCDTFGPMAIEATQPGLFWYGIHCVEMLFAVLGPNCESVTVKSNDNYDLVVGQWTDGRIGTIRGNRTGNYYFGAMVHRASASAFADITACEKPYYASLLENIVEFSKTRVAACSIEDAARIAQFIECANESRQTGETVHIAPLML